MKSSLRQNFGILVILVKSKYLKSSSNRVIKWNAFAIPEAEASKTNNKFRSLFSKKIWCTMSPSNSASVLPEYKNCCIPYWTLSYLYQISSIFSHVTKPYYRTSKLPVRRPISSNIRSFFINSFIVRDISQYFVDATVQVRFNAQHDKNKPIVITERTAEK